MKKAIRKIFAGLGVLLLVVVIAILALFWNEIFTLGSLKTVDRHPLYRMAYQGDYGFSDFLKVGATSDRDIEHFVVKRLLKGIDIDLSISSAGCSAFSAWNEKGERIFGRNFDFDYAPAMLLKTTPSDGYASVSVVNLAFAGYGAGYLPKPFDFSSFLTLAAPYLPFDGMNEKGVAMALLAVPHAEPPTQSGKVMLNTTAMIRLVLDHAASVEEALTLMEGYSLYFSGGVECHYLISDSKGDAAIVEYLDGAMKITMQEKNYQAVTNFIVFEGRNEGEGGTEFERYDTLVSRFNAAGGILDEEAAMTLLSDVKIPGRTQWSLVYNQSTGEIDICMGEKYDKVYAFAMGSL